MVIEEKKKNVIDEAENVTSYIWLLLRLKRFIHRLLQRWDVLRAEKGITEAVESC
jgi:hypothetical protein